MIEQIVNNLRCGLYRDLCYEVLNDDRFHMAPGSSGHHHAWKGGLYEHTEEVLLACRDMATDGEMAELLTVAAVFHDRNKIFEYRFEVDGSITKLPYLKLIGHVTGSWQFFVECSNRLGLDAENHLKIGHCLLSHHGRLEWRSPVEPQTQEAFILHSADMLSMLKGKEKKL